MSAYFQVYNNCNGYEESEENTEADSRNSLSTSFTISFENNEKQRNSLQSSFRKTHHRTSSLPTSNGYSNSAIPRNTKKHAVVQPEKKKSVSELRGHINILTATVTNDEDGTSDDASEVYEEKSEYLLCDKDDGVSSDDGATYTLERHNKPLQLARKSIDQVFGIRTPSPPPFTTSTPSNNMNQQLAEKSRMIDEWMVKSSFVSSNSNKLSVSADPLQARDEGTKQRKKNALKLSLPERKSCQPPPPSPDQESYHKLTTSTSMHALNGNYEAKKLTEMEDTSRFLNETREIVAAIENRIELDHSSAVVTTNTKHNERSTVKQTNSNQLLPNPVITNSKLNRAFSLRREKAMSGGKTAIPVLVRSYSSAGTVSFQHNKSSTSRSLAKPAWNDSSRSSLSVSNNVKSKYASPTSSTSGTRIGNCNSSTGIIPSTRRKFQSSPPSLRSKSTLTSHELEFQNWKRRKSYDPRKAAAQDRKKKSSPNISISENEAPLKWTLQPPASDRRSSCSSIEAVNAHIVSSLRRRERALLSDVGRRLTASTSLCMRYDDDDVDVDERSADDTTEAMTEPILSGVSTPTDELYENDVPKPPSSSLDRTPPTESADCAKIIHRSSSILLSASTDEPRSIAMRASVDVVTVAALAELSIKVKKLVLATLTTRTSTCRCHEPVGSDRSTTSPMPDIGGDTSDDDTEDAVVGELPSDDANDANRQLRTTLTNLNRVYNFVRYYERKNKFNPCSSCK